MVRPLQISPGSKLGAYEIQSRLGTGGMGSVYRARDAQLGREVAIKVLGDETARNADALKRLVAEAKAASALNHPNIMTVYGIGTEGEHPYLVCELIEGETLRAALARGPMPVPEVLDIAIQVLSGLAKAHAIGLVHRDLKPDNLMRTEDGLVKILDFGLAKLLQGDPGVVRPLDSLGLTATAAGVVLGTATHMSPEQARGQPAQVRSDLFSFGVILYEMLSGTNPFHRGTLADTMVAILRDEAPALGGNVPPRLAATIQRLLQKDPEKRPASSKEVLAELQALRQELDPTAPLSFASNTTAARPAPAAATRRLVVVALAIPLLLAAAFWALRSRTQAEPSPFEPGVPVIGVMAIEDKTADADLAQADVGHILSDAFVQILYDCHGVKVVSPLRIKSLTMAENRSFGDTARDLDLVRRVCKHAGANTILAGSLSRIGETFVLNATLTDLETGDLLGNFNASASGKGDLLPSLTASLAPSVQKNLSQRFSTQIATGRGVGDIVTSDFTAYAHLTRGSDLTFAGEWEAALRELTAAVEIDSNLALAWSEMACAYSFMEDEASARRAQDRAMQLRSRLSRKEQMWIDATTVWLTGDGPKYRAAFEQFMREFPDDRQGLFYVGLGWEWLDDNCAEAIRVYEKAYALTPEFYPITKGLVDCHLKLGAKDEAIRALDRYLEGEGSGAGSVRARDRRTELSGRPGV